MFRTEELGRKVSKGELARQETVLLQELLEMQQKLRHDGTFPAIIVFAGVDGAGKGKTVNLFNPWDDYAAAVNDVVEQASTRKAPWVLVESNDKRFARVNVITAVRKAMAREVRLEKD